MNKMLGLRLMCLALLVFAIWYVGDNFDGAEYKYGAMATFLMATIIMVVHALSKIYEKLEEIHQTMLSNQPTESADKTE